MYVAGRPLQLSAYSTPTVLATHSPTVDYTTPTVVTEASQAYLSHTHNMVSGLIAFHRSPQLTVEQSHKPAAAVSSASSIPREKQI
jgi:hypothetical protein